MMIARLPKGESSTAEGAGGIVYQSPYHAAMHWRRRTRDRRGSSLLTMPYLPIIDAERLKVSVAIVSADHLPSLSCVVPPDMDRPVCSRDPLETEASSNGFVLTAYADRPSVNLCRKQSD
ncbi:hypothetical protein M8818_007068 [Zalaria obscura]|uniref:Uncharacterized protein n=1 Tax=Zalaria obscura TaxID=2024903 RepID=A0ACC3S475_9PEZI